MQSESTALPTLPGGSDIHGAEGNRLTRQSTSAGLGLTSSILYR